MVRKLVRGRMLIIFSNLMVDPFSFLVIITQKASIPQMLYELRFGQILDTSFPPMSRGQAK